MGGGPVGNNLNTPLLLAVEWFAFTNGLTMHRTNHFDAVEDLNLVLGDDQILVLSSTTNLTRTSNSLESA